MAFMCGSFHNQEDDELQSWNKCSSPKRSKRIGSFKFKSESKNPYADRGLEKFDALLAELDYKKQKIYTQKGAEDISLVRFVYSNDNKIKPLVVVKVKDKKQDQKNMTEANHHSNNAKDKHIVKGISNSETSEKQTIESSSTTTSSSSSSLWTMMTTRRFSFKLEKFIKKPTYFLAMIIILILLFLAMYGRSFAILCTSIGWYLIPSTKGDTNSTTTTSRNQKRKKDYTRRFSDKRPANNEGSSSPTSVITGPMDNVSPCRKSF